MDDLDDIAALLTKPEPPREVLLRSRGRLQDRIDGRTRHRRRVNWLVPSVALAATVTAAVAVVTVDPAPSAVPAAPTTTTSAAVSVGDLSGKEILLMAAVSAERTPQTTGTYWHVTSTSLNSDMPPIESWTRRDGRRWTRAMPGDPADTVLQSRNPLSLKGADISLDDLAGLPTDPEALKTWIVQRQGNPDDMSLSEQRDEPLFPLITLISELPTPPEVRAAAFKALATTPGVRSTGAVEGGQALAIPDPGYHGWEIKMVVDPETAQVKRTNFLLGGDGSVTLSGDAIALATEWTDELPKQRYSAFAHGDLEGLAKA
ncbi:CU044_5270 family protein [Streptosporangium sp. NPDC000239]|uniref:CU044_5270 family protein n=1 Tax=Streptosporangium sp. NPDC000239 TaxID=3154248 RepID=UPI0033171702